MRSAKFVRASLVGVLALGLGAVSPGIASAAEGEPTLAEQAAESLPAGELAKWNALTDDQKAVVNTVLEDPNFGVPGAEALVEDEYSVVEVTEEYAPESSAVSSRAVTTAATGTRTSWYRQNWKILGVTYAQVQTNVNYSYSGSRVTRISSCYGVITNYVPLRQWDKINTQSLNSDGTATCRTEVWLARPLQPTQHGIQGLRVNGNGTIIKTWSL
ncbi:hypothetical protein ACFVTZ_03895 [Cellulosimicrobium cellulans]|uniref:hypothetical protein n=1 Tax=Cellulosimicrobium cellulans TaxID=1710 RepID=UPI0036E49180